MLANQFDKAIERMTASDETMRVGGVYALENVLNNSEVYNQAAFDTLCEFVRHNSRTERTNNEDGPPATDIQVALTVIGRRRGGPGLASGDQVRRACDEIGRGRPDLGGAHIPKAELGRANEVGMANLACASLKDVNLAHAVLYNANLTGAWLYNAKLAHAVLPHANLTGAWLLKAHATGVDLSNADLTDADLRGADLTDANLRGADLTGAWLLKAQATGADLIDTDLTDADLRGAKYSVKTIFPSPFNPKAAGMISD